MDFPKEKRTTMRSGDVLFYYEAGPVDDWLKSCKEDAPKNMDTDWKDWFNKWFSQFQEEE